MLCVYVNVNVNGMLREKIGGEWRGGEIGLENKYTITDSSHPQGNADRGRIDPNVQPGLRTDALERWVSKENEDK